MKKLRKILCVVVCYNPDEKVVKNLQKHSEFFESIIVIDNSNVSNNYLFVHISNIVYVPMYENLGTAIALNCIIKKEGSEFDIFAIFDQDSSILSCDLLSVEEALFENSIDVLYPSYSMDGATNIVHAKKVGHLALPFMSGLMIKRSVFDTGLVFNEEFFLDYVDFDFDISLYDVKMKVCELEGYILQHGLGNLRRHELLGKTWTVTNHNLSRRASITRNRLKMYRKYIKKYNRWVLSDLKSMLYEFFCIIMFEKDKIRKVFIQLKEVVGFLSLKTERREK